MEARAANRAASLKYDMIKRYRPRDETISTGREDASSRYRDANGKDRQVPASINEVAVGKERLGERRVVVKGPKAKQSNGLHRKRRTDWYQGEERRVNNSTAIHLYIGELRGRSPAPCISSRDSVPVHLGGPAPRGDSGGKR